VTAPDLATPGTALDDSFGGMYSAPGVARSPEPCPPDFLGLTRPALREPLEVGEESPPDVAVPTAPTVARWLTVWTEELGRQAVAERSGGRCELGCGRPMESWGHRQRRSQGGLWAPWNGLALCGDGTRGCHGRLTGDPALAAGGGWEVPSHADPAVVPVWLATTEGAGWWLLGEMDGAPDGPCRVVSRHVRLWVDPDDYGLPARPRLPYARPAQSLFPPTKKDHR